MSTHLDSRLIDRRNPVPLYLQIADAIENEMAEGRLIPGKMLPPEVELAESFGVSRPTIRQAIGHLIDRRLIIKRRGIGNLVASRKIVRDMAINLFDYLQAEGRNPIPVVLSLELQRCPDDVREKLELPPGALAYRLERILYADNTDSAPIAYLINYVVAPGTQLDREELSHMGLYQHLRNHGLQVSSVLVSIEARAADVQLAEILSMEVGGPVLAQVRDAYDDLGRPVESGLSFYPGDRYSFVAHLSSH